MFRGSFPLSANLAVAALIRMSGSSVNSCIISCPSTHRDSLLNDQRSIHWVQRWSGDYPTVVYSRWKKSLDSARTLGNSIVLGK